MSKTKIKKRLFTNYLKHNTKIKKNKSRKNKKGGFSFSKEGSIVKIAQVLSFSCRELYRMLRTRTHMIGESSKHLRNNLNTICVLNDNSSCGSDLDCQQSKKYAYERTLTFLQETLLPLCEMDGSYDYEVTEINKWIIGLKNKIGKRDLIINNRLGNVYPGVIEAFNDPLFSNSSE